MPLSSPSRNHKKCSLWFKSDIYPLGTGMSTNHTLAELNGMCDVRPETTDSPRESDTTDFQTVTLAPFLNKLHEIVSKGEAADSIRWGEG